MMWCTNSFTIHFTIAAAFHRCVVLLNGFYEWHKPGTSSSATKQPYYIHRCG